MLMKLNGLTDISKNEIEQFSTEECHVLALAFHLLYGWSILIALDHKNPFYEDENITIPGVIHCYAVDENNNTWDIFGCRPFSKTAQECKIRFSVDTLDLHNLKDEESLKDYTDLHKGRFKEIERPLVGYTESDILNAKKIAKRLREKMDYNQRLEIIKPALFEITKKFEEFYENNVKIKFIEEDESGYLITINEGYKNVLYGKITLRDGADDGLENKGNIILTFDDNENRLFTFVPDNHTEEVCIPYDDNEGWDQKVKSIEKVIQHAFISVAPLRGRPYGGGSTPKPVFRAEIAYRTPAGRKVWYSKTVAAEKAEDCEKMLRDQLLKAGANNRRRVKEIIGEFKATFISHQIPGKRNTPYIREED